MAPRKRVTTGDPGRAIGYLRVSTDEQRLGPEAQRENLAAYAERAGVEIVDVFVDHGVSGAAEIDKRPALLAALAAIEEHGAGVLLVAKRDRLARSIEQSAIVTRLAESRGASIHSADGVGNDSSAESVLLRGIVDSFAQFERAMIAARTKAALGVKKARGERVGSVPYGYRLASDGVQLEVEPVEAAAVELARQLRGSGKSLRAVAEALQEAGYQPRGGGRWHPQTVSNITAAAGAVC